MKNYNLVIDPNLEGLINTVNNAIEMGYEPIGGLLFVNGNFIQTIILKK